MIRRVLVQSDAHKAPQRQRVRQPPGNPALRPDALEIPDQQRPKVNPRRQRRTPVLGRIELRTPLLDKLVEALGLQQLIQTLIKRMPWSRRQLGVRDPDLLLLLPLLARPHRHAPILQTNSVDTVKVLAYEPGLAPRAVSQLCSYRGNRDVKRSAIWGMRTAVLLLVLLTASWSAAQSSKMSKDLQAVPSGTPVNVVVQYYNPPATTDVNAAKAQGASNGKAIGLLKGYRWSMSQS